MRSGCAKPADCQLGVNTRDQRRVSTGRETLTFGEDRRWSQCSSERHHVRPCHLCGRGSLQTVRLAGDGTGEITN